MQTLTLTPTLILSSNITMRLTISAIFLLVGSTVTAFAPPAQRCNRPNNNGFAVYSSPHIALAMSEAATMADSGKPPASTNSDMNIADAEIPTRLPTDVGMDYVPLATMLATGQLAEADQVRQWMIKGDSMPFLFRASWIHLFLSYWWHTLYVKRFHCRDLRAHLTNLEILSSPKPTITEQFTRDALVVLAGSKEKGRDFVYFTEVKRIPSTDLATIERLWNKFSGGKFGYSVQKVSPISTHIMLRICAQWQPLVDIDISLDNSCCPFWQRFLPHRLLFTFSDFFIEKVQAKQGGLWGVLPENRMEYEGRWCGAQEALVWCIGIYLWREEGAGGPLAADKCIEGNLADQATFESPRLGQWGVEKWALEIRCSAFLLTIVFEVE